MTSSTKCKSGRLRRAPSSPCTTAGKLYSINSIVLPVLELLKRKKFPFTNSEAGTRGVKDDYTEIEFLKDYKYAGYPHKSNNVRLDTFEKSSTDAYYSKGFCKYEGEEICKVTYHKVTSDGNLDGRVSSVRIAFPHREKKQ